MSTSDDVLRQIEKRAGWEYLPIVGADKGQFLEGLIRAKKPCRAVEVGVLVGYATIIIARNLAEGCQVHGVEISAEMVARAKSNLEEAGLTAKAVILLGDAREKLAEIPGPVDFVLLDAQRSQYLSYLKKLEPKLAPGAVIVANGTAAFHREVAGYLEYVRDSADYQSESRVFGDDAAEISVFRRP